MAESTYTVDAACQNCGWGGKLAIRFGEKAPTGGIAGSKRTCERCGVYAVTTMSDERRKGVDMRPCAGDEVNAAWAEVNRLRSRLAEVEADEQRAREELVRELARVLEAAQRLEAEVERLRAAIVNHRSAIDAAGPILVMDERSAQRAAAKHRADTELWAMVAPAGGD